MTNYERFVKTLNREIPDRIVTYDLIDNTEILARYGGEGDLLERNARMCQRIGLDATRYIHDPEHHWLGAKIKNWIRFFDVNPADWAVTETGGTAWIGKRPFGCGYFGSPANSVTPTVPFENLEALLRTFHEEMT